MLRHKPGSYSLVMRVSLILVAFFFLMAAFLFGSNLYSFYVLRRTVYDFSGGMLRKNQEGIEHELRNAVYYLTSVSINNTVTLSDIANDDGTNTYYTSLQRLRTDLTNNLAALNNIDGLFVYPASTRLLIYACADNTAAMAAQAFRDQLRQAQDARTLDTYVSTAWQLHLIQDEAYLIHVTRNHDIYLGAWVSVRNLLREAASDSTLASHCLYLTRDTAFLENGREDSGWFFPVQTYSSTDTVTLEHKTYLPITVSVASHPGGAIALLIPTTRFTAVLRPTYLLLLALSLTCLVFGLLAMHLVRRNLLRPLQRLQQSMQALEKGDFSVRVPEKQMNAELARVDATFNHMAGRIQTLKIQVYEEQLRLQKTELLALKNQIAPHFLINSLNAVYHMAAAGKNESVQQMALTLSTHLRYALSDETTVRLEEEAAMVENYVRLSRLRYPDSIELFMDMEDDTMCLMVPPMILLFQVENIIKYEVLNGEVTEIHIEVNQDYLSGQDYTHICIWDTGTGYATDVLQQLSSPEMLSQSDGHNIGTRNILQRLHLLFGDSMRMTFTNRADAGAQVDIWLPETTEKTLPVQKGALT